MNDNQKNWLTCDCDWVEVVILIALVVILVAEAMAGH